MKGDRFMMAGIVLVGAAVLMVLHEVFEKDGAGRSAWDRYRRRRKEKRDPRTGHYRKLLDSYYKCRVPYYIEVCNCRPKRYMGLYFPEDAVIRIYAGWQKYYSLDEIALHEYAHHIQDTEYPETLERGEFHNEAFWNILAMLKERRLEAA